MYQVIAKLFGFMLGDGWISVNKKYPSTLCSGFSGDELSLQNAINDLNYLFGKDLFLKISTRKTCSAYYGIEGTTSYFAVPNQVGNYFKGIGMPTGKKVEQEFLLPDWLITADLDIKKAFISGLYCAEGLTPAMQQNDKTPKILGFALTKRLFYEDNLICLMNQIGNMLKELNIGFSIRKEYTLTCDENIKIIIEFANNINNLLAVCDILDLSYALDKKEKLAYLKAYLFFKKQTLNKLDKAYQEALDKCNKIIDIANKYNIKYSQIHHWRTRKTGYRIPNNFPTLTEFINKSYSPL